MLILTLIKLIKNINGLKSCLVSYNVVFLFLCFLIVTVENSKIYVKWLTPNLSLSASRQVTRVKGLDLEMKGIQLRRII